MARRIVSVSCFVAGFGIGQVLLGTVSKIKAAHQLYLRKEEKLQLAQDRTRVLADYALDSSNPEFTRKRFYQLEAEMPELEDLFRKCLDQMDSMDALQAKQSYLIESNHAQYLRNTIGVLDEVERRLCRNFKNIVNLCIAAVSPESVDMDKVEQFLGDNRTKLSDVQELLRISADWINQYNKGIESDSSDVENWIAVIRESLRED